MITKIQNSFLLFVKNMEQFELAPYQLYLIDLIDKQLVNKPLDGRLMISLPPGAGKSWLCSQLLPAFLLGRDPTLRIMIVSFSGSTANELGRFCKKYVSSATYRAIFPQTVLKSHGGDSGSFETTKGGCLYCVGRGGSITSRRFNYILCDDTIKDSSEAISETIINKLRDWFASTVITRFYMRGGALCILSTRWCERDLIGYCQSAYNDAWLYVNLPAIADSKNDPLGRKIGEVLNPKMQSLETLMLLKEGNPKQFSALYQGKPVSEDSTIIKETQLALSLQATQKGSHIFIAWDTASEVHDRADFTVASVFEVTKGSAYVTHIYRFKAEFADLVEKYDSINTLHKPCINIIENASSGRQLLQVRKESSVPSACFKDSDKLSHAETLNFSLGKSLFFSASLDITKFSEELLSFPYGKHDDVVLSLLHGWRFYTSEKYLEYEARVTLKRNRLLKQVKDTLKLSNSLRARVSSFLVH